MRGTRARGYFPLGAHDLGDRHPWAFLDCAREGYDAQEVDAAEEDGWTLDCRFCSAGKVNI